MNPTHTSRPRPVDAPGGPDAVESSGAPADGFPRRIVCLTEETTETLYLLGEGWRVVGVSGYTVRPPEARKKPRVSAFVSAKIDKILALEPDLVLAFSDLQADIAAELTKLGLDVFTFNQRTVDEILRMIRVLGGIVGRPGPAAALVETLEADLALAARAADAFPRRPRVFVEEWDDPLIAGIAWVDELVERAGGSPTFPELRSCALARDRIVDPIEAARRDPEVVIASWCGKAVRRSTIGGRAGWERTAAVRHGHVYEIKSSYILQPGPAALTEGLRQLHLVLSMVVGVEPDARLLPQERVDPALRP